MIEKFFMLSYFLPLFLLLWGSYILTRYKRSEKIISILFFNASSLSFWFNTALASVLGISVFNLPILITIAVISIILLILLIVMILLMRKYEKQDA